jgi:Mg-chelatase subunit ChlD
MVFFKNKQIFHTGLGILLLTLFTFPVQAQTASPDATSPDEISQLVGMDTPADSSLISATGFSDTSSDIVLLLDNSGSMKVNDPQFLTAKAVTEFINQLDDNTRLGIVIFDQKVTLAHPLTEITSQSRAEMLTSLKKINYKGLHTNSPDGLERAIFELKLHAREDAERFIVFLTDGIVDTGDKQKDITKLDWMRKELAADASNNDIRIFGIAFTDGADFQLMQSLAQQTNAEYFRAFSADMIADVFVQIQDRITKARLEALEAEIEASKPPPPPVIVAPPPPAPPPKPIIVQVPEPKDSKMTRYMLFGIAGLLVIVLVIVLLRGRSSGTAGEGLAAGGKMPDVQLIDMGGITDQESYPLTTAITQIGRIKGKESEGVTYIIIPEKSISRHHAVIEYRNHDFWVMDQGSGNGTKLKTPSETW